MSQTGTSAAAWHVVTPNGVPEARFGGAPDGAISKEERGRLVSEAVKPLNATIVQLQDKSARWESEYRTMARRVHRLEAL
eukprot:7769466-Lingulodinium_polyedra.AAC.1